MKFLPKFDIKLDKALLIAFVALGAVVLILEIFSPSSVKKEILTESSHDTVDVDTMIPAGHLLIPLELSNAESLASLSGPFSLVDLYVSGDKGKKGYKVASAVKLVRAPLNPQQFAVLVREDESSKIVTQEGPFFAALKNPKEVSRRSPAKSSLHIDYGD